MQVGAGREKAEKRKARCVFARSILIREESAELTSSSG
jgi:hypothetical protein